MGGWGGPPSMPECRRPRDTHSPLLPTMVGRQHRCVDLLYVVFLILFLLKQDIVPWGAGLGRTKCGQLAFTPVKPPTYLQVVEQAVSWDGHWWPEFSWWWQFFWEHIVVIQSGKWLGPLLIMCNRAIRWGRDLNQKEIASVYMNWKKIWNPKVSSCSGFFVGSPSSFLLITYDRMKFTKTFHFPDSCPRSRNSGWGRICASLGFFSVLHRLSSEY